jgi:hypothetical protein|tara:strand:- start:243 stop:692 length:450 start_codon:yes stop_codon:yes gene_type:complete
VIPFINLLKYLPNIAEIPRDVIISQTSKDTDYKFSSVYSGERDAFLGLDVTVSNESGSQAFFFIDGRSYWVLDASIRTLTNIPYDTFKIGTTGGTANSIDLTFFGISLGLIRQYTGLSNYEMLYDNTVFMTQKYKNMKTGQQMRIGLRS